MTLEEKRRIMREVYEKHLIVIERFTGDTACVVKSAVARSQFDLDDEVEAANAEIRRRFDLAD